MKLARMPDGSSEIFHSVQGEGRFTGRDSTFVRASLCNLSCFWCDTPYTWHWEGDGREHREPRAYRREEEIIDLPVAEVAEIASGFGCSHYVFTGGEPLLQEVAWVELMDRLCGSDPASTFEIETNGTLLPGPAFLERIGQINVSPKLANSRVEEAARRKPGVLGALAATGKADFKFVLAEESDFEEIQALVEEAGIPSDRVFLMPEANSVEELDRREPIVAELARSHGHHYSDRLHLRLFGAGRGV